MFGLKNGLNVENVSMFGLKNGLNEENVICLV